MTTDQPFSNTLPHGYLLHWYRIKSVLGRGAYGITYLAQDQNLDQSVAIKEYLPVEFASRQANDTVHPLTGEHNKIYHWGLDRFLKEAKTLAKFKHPNIVRVLSVFEHNNTAYMVMEYERGEDLSRIYKSRNQISEQELLSIFLPVLDGLKLVHQAGFIHRDIKPSNIFIRDNGTPVLIDFGSARQSSGNTSRALTTLVTYGYAPFEQYNEGDNNKQGPWTDIYALSASIYCTVCGKLPVEALKRGAELLNQNADPYEPAAKLGAGAYSKHFLKAIDAALNFHAKDRPQTIDEWVCMLHGVEYIAPVEASQQGHATHAAHFNSQNSNPLTSQTLNTDFFRGTTQQLNTAVQFPHRTQFIPLPKNKIVIALAVLGLLIMGTIYYAFIFRQQSVTQTSPPPPSTATTPEKPIPSTAVEPKPDNQARIKQLLDGAQADMQADRLTKPRGNNALEKYRQITNLQQDHTQAVRGLEEIALQLISVTNQALSQGDLGAASVAAGNFADAFPDDKRVAELTAAIETSKSRNKEIATLLSKAQSALADNRHTQPAADSALHYYRNILQANKEHALALEGIANLQRHFEKQTRRLLDEENISAARDALHELEAVNPKANTLPQLKAALAKLENRQAHTAELLSTADELFRQGYYFNPPDKNAWHVYQNVLAQDSDNQGAATGLQNIKNTQAKNIRELIAANNLKAAQQQLATLRQFAAQDTLTQTLADEIEKALNAKPKRPEMDIFSDMLNTFKSAFEKKDIGTLNRISEYQPGRKDFIVQLFEQYQSFKLALSGVHYIGTERRGRADIKITELIYKDGSQVQPAAWGQFEIVVRPDNTKDWKVYW